MKKAILFVIAVIYVVSVSSCATQETCWAYRSTTKYNKSKNRPSVAGAMNHKRAKVVYYR